ncbi:MAG TPA: lipopolysaccharide kinase InaA family protein [Candidatus Hydrogenedentes bacterium]|nr:lipopolysaccharide kinase InaA family protein [Candidatus Hydrogenedentota bacterium]HOL75601.1 lipopolysaccharide kinase InaA family protein [Candidatus Hydrogenedentota bacterium]
MLKCAKKRTELPPRFLWEQTEDFAVLRRTDISVKDILAAIKEQGHVLKISPKWQVTRYKDWVLKTSNEAGVFTMVRRSMSRKNAVDICHVSQYMRKRNLPCPEIYAVVEWRLLGMVRRECVISQYLPNSVSVEQYIRDIIKTPAPENGLTQFFQELGNVLRQLLASDVYHSDLSGKNILTADGKNFFFIDLEAVNVRARYTKRKVLKNAVQVYDSFCDMVSDEVLEPFLYSFLPPEWRTRKMLSLIKDKQMKRRQKHLQKLKKMHCSSDPDPIC